MEVAVKDRRRLHVIACNTLLQHVEYTCGDVFESGLGERPYNIDAGDASLKDIFSGGKIRRNVAGERVLAAVRIGHGLDLLVRYRRQVQVAEYSLDSAGRFISHADDVLFRNGLQAAVHLHVSLQYIVIVKVFRIEVRSGKHIIVIGFSRISGENEVGSRKEFEHRSCGASHVRVGEALVVGRSTFQTEERCDKVL